MTTKTVIHKNPALPENGQRVVEDGPDEFNAKLGTAIANGASDAVKRAETLVQRLEDAKAACELGVSGWKQSWLEWIKPGETYLSDLRMWQQAVTREQQLAVRAMKDISDMLGSDKHAESIGKRRELIELCERAKALRESGFLDAVVDTLVKVDK
jgi:hypothetical protein